jgi:hypothetical protein
VLHAVAWPVSWDGWRCNPSTLGQAHLPLPVAGGAPVVPRRVLQGLDFLPGALQHAISLLLIPGTHKEEQGKASFPLTFIFHGLGYPFIRGCAVYSLQ